jgi:hypothetical protein
MLAVYPFSFTMLAMAFVVGMIMIWGRRQDYYQE